MNFIFVNQHQYIRVTVKILYLELDVGIFVLKDYFWDQIKTRKICI